MAVLPQAVAGTLISLAVTATGFAVSCPASASVVLSQPHTLWSVTPESRGSREASGKNATAPLYVGGSADHCKEGSPGNGDGKSAQSHIGVSPAFSLRAIGETMPLSPRRRIGIGNIPSVPIYLATARLRL